MSRTSNLPSILKHVDKLLFALSVLLLGFWSYSAIDSYLYQKSESRRLEQMKGHHDNSVFSAKQARAESNATGLIGRIEVSRLGISAIVSEGTDESTLRRAVGHVAGTAFPGEPGNVGLAAHRDSFFRKLKDIAVADTVRLSTPDGEFIYIVDTTMVVRPDREDLLDSTATPALTLVTCYPFHYIGRAPKRFIVQARQVPAAVETVPARGGSGMKSEDASGARNTRQTGTSGRTRPENLDFTPRRPL